jgi:hypothetical protein
VGELEGMRWPASIPWFAYVWSGVSLLMRVVWLGVCGGTQIALAVTVVWVDKHTSHAVWYLTLVELNCEGGEGCQLCQLAVLERLDGVWVLLPVVLERLVVVSE